MFIVLSVKPSFQPREGLDVMAIQRRYLSITAVQDFTLPLVMTLSLPCHAASALCEFVGFPAIDTKRQLWNR